MRDSCTGCWLKIASHGSRLPGAFGFVSFGFVSFTLESRLALPMVDVVWLVRALLSELVGWLFDWLVGWLFAGFAGGLVGVFTAVFTPVAVNVLGDAPGDAPFAVVGLELLLALLLFAVISMQLAIVLRSRMLSTQVKQKDNSLTNSSSSLIFPFAFFYD